MRFKSLAFASLSLLLCGFTKQTLQTVHDIHVKDGVNRLKVLHLNKNSSTPSAVQKFNNQSFTLWLLAKELNDLPTYYSNIVTFCKNHNIKKVVWYLGYTSQSASFYDPHSTNPSSFVQLLTNANTALPATTQLELRIECASMAPSFLYTGASPAPTAPTFTVLPNYMSSSQGCLYNCLWWVRDLFKAVSPIKPNLISGVTIDPQNNCTSDVLPYTINADLTSAAIIADQALVNYLDEFASVNADFYPLQRGMTFDGSAKKQIFGNRATLPITDPLLINDTSLVYDTSNGLSMYFYNKTSPTRTAPWTRPDPTAPFLHNVYPQLYNLQAPFIYTLSNQPQLAGIKFLQFLSSIPYCPGLTSNGTPSHISFTQGSKDIIGLGTRFDTELNSSGLNGNSPLAVIDQNGQQQCLIPTTDPSTACGAKVSTITDDTHLSLASPVTINTPSTPLPWLYTETEINYLEYALTPEMVSGISMTFSAEGDPAHAFFGTWTLDQFMNFMTTFYAQGQTSYSPYRSASAPIQVPNLFTIFTYEEMTGRVSPSPPNIWFPGE